MATTKPSFTCPNCGMVSYNCNDVDQKYCGKCHRFFLGMGAYLEPDVERNSPYHRKIVETTPIPNTRSGHRAVLNCGHHVVTFGNLDHASGLVLCTQCRDKEQAHGND